jgi:hypothetical protein
MSCYEQKSDPRGSSFSQPSFTGTRTTIGALTAIGSDPIAENEPNKVISYIIALALRVNTLPGKLEHATEGIRRPFW